MSAILDSALTPDRRAECVLADAADVACDAVNPNAVLAGVVINMRRARDARLSNWTPANTNPTPVYLPDAISECMAQCRREGDGDSDASTILYDQIQAQLERDEEVRAALVEALTEIRGALEDRQDVVDGADGEQRPNEAMRLLAEFGPMLRAVIAKATGAAS